MRTRTNALLRYTALATACLLSAPLAAEECFRPYPVTLPAEPPAGEPDMLELQGKVKDYLAEANAYLDCNEAEQRALEATVKNEVGDDDAQVQIQILVTRYNNTVDEMHVVGDRYNQLVRAFRGDEDPEDSPGGRDSSS